MADADIGKAHAQLTRTVIDLPGVTGVAVGLKAGRPCLKVYVDKKDGPAGKKIPKSVLGLDVVVEETGRFRRQ